MIKFDINKKSDIINGKYKVVTRSNDPVRIIEWNRKGVFNIIGLVLLEHDDVELLKDFKSDGSHSYKESKYDLFLIENN